MFSFLRRGLLPPPSQPQSDLPPQDNTLYPREARDVYHATFLLRSVLVADLVPYILDLAEYWTRLSTTRNDETQVDEAAEDLGAPYLALTILKHDSRWLRKIVFTVESRDQGWSSHRADQGTYENSWTWFEVRVRSPVRQYPYEDARRRGLTRTLFRNVHAGKDYKIHTATLSVNATDEQERNWVKSLDTGSQISIVPMARYPGWCNHVKRARINIYFAAVR